MADRIYNVLFLCSGNSARSIFAEALLNQLGAGRFRAFSAGSQPADEVHPLAIEVLQRLGFDTAFARSKHWDEFAEAGAPELDFVFTVCDKAAGEVCPVWPGHPALAHWGVPDPAKNPDDPKGFKNAWLTLRRRIELLLALPLEKLDHLAREQELRLIGKEV